MSQEDLTDNANLLSHPTTSGLHVRFESQANRQEIPPNEYRMILRELNEKQKAIVMFHRDWCKKAVLSLKKANLLNHIECF